MFLRKHFPKTTIDVVDIDPDVVEVAKKFFGFREDERLHAHVAEPPLPHKDAPRIKRCHDATNIERLHRLLSIPRFITLALRCECTGASDRRVAALTEMQAFSCLGFHRLTK